MRITLSARSKILSLQSEGLPFRIQVTGSIQAGSHVDLIPHSNLGSNDVTICTAPLIIADFQTINHLVNQTVDFDYNTQEFIISNRGNER